MAAGLGFGALGCAGFGLAAALVSTESTRAAIEQRLEAWIGRKVDIAGEVTFSAFPTLAVSAERLRIGDETAPLLTTERIDGRLSVLSLLIGRVELADLTVTRPKLDLAAEDAAVLGGVWRRVGEGDGLGAIRIDDGQATIASEAGPRRIENLNLSVVAHGEHEPIVAKGSFRYRGEPVQIRSTLARPGRLVRGRASRIRASFVSPRLKLSVRGRADLQPDFAFEGSFSTSAASLREALDWLKLPAGEGQAVEAFALSGRLGVTGGVATLSEADLDLDGNRFEGAIAFGYESERPVLQATLDARHLELGPWIARHARTAPDFSASTLLAVDGDIRVSAESLTIGDAKLGSTAAAVVMRDRQVEITLGEMNVFAGTLSGRVTLETGDSGTQLSAALRADHIDAGQFLMRISDEPALTGRLDATAALSGKGHSWRDVVATLTGDARLRLSEGTIRQSPFTDDRLDELVRTAGHVVDQASAGFTISEGVAETQDLEIGAPGLRATARGTLSLADGRIDLEGIAVNKDATLSESPFRLGGNWQDPVFMGLPVATMRAQIERPRPNPDILPAADGAAPHEAAGGGLFDRIMGRF